MARGDLSDLMAFLAVARERSFTRAAAKLGVSQSALSHTIRRLETRMGLRLLTRSTRSVSPTEAGERLVVSIGPRFEEIEAEIEALSELRDKPAGTIRITAGEHAVNTILWPRLDPFLSKFPDIKIEIYIENRLADIVAERHDAGVRLGEHVAKDMIAVRIGPDWRLVVVGSPSYFASCSLPQTPHDLTDHRCINLRLTTYGGLYAWEFDKAGQALNVRVDGQLVFNSTLPILRATLAGHGLAYIPEDMALPHIARGELTCVLDDWCQPFPGYHLYYPSRRQASPAFAAVVDALRYRD
ncbi:MAG: LysR family transcriptional regulator [Mesorhizobium sp.]